MEGITAEAAAGIASPSQRVTAKYRVEIRDVRFSVTFSRNRCIRAAASLPASSSTAGERAHQEQTERRRYPIIVAKRTNVPQGVLRQDFALARRARGLRSIPRSCFTGDSNGLSVIDRRENSRSVDLDESR